MELEQKQLEKIVQILEYFIGKKSLEERYNVKIPDFPERWNISLAQKKGYSANVKLKKALSKILSKQDQKQRKEIADWIIYDWGGISKPIAGSERTKKVSEILQDSSDKEALKKHADELKLSGDCIPTISKVLSFISPEKYAICDSRVIFSLNWLLFLSGKENLTQFSELPTRNNILKSYSLNFLLEKLSLKPGTKINKYSDYLEVMQQIKDEISLKKTPPEKWELYDTEMLLFSLAADLESGLPFLIRELILNNAKKSFIDEINEKLNELLAPKNAS